MAKDTVTLKADGSVSIADFRTVVEAMDTLLAALTTEATQNEAAVEWVVDKLEAGSATIISRGRSTSQLTSRSVADVVARYEQVARGAHEGRIEGFSIPVQEAVRQLAGLLDGRITRIWMSGTDRAWPINPRLGGAAEDPDPQGAGVDFRRYVRSAVKGQVVTLDQKQSVYFTLREAHTGRNIRCYPTERHKKDLSDYWASGRWIIVEGTFSRHGTVPTMYNITDIVPLEVASRGSWREAVGCAPRQPDEADVSSADAVRRVRDGEE